MMANGPISHPNPHCIAWSMSSVEYAMSGATLAVYSSVGLSVSRRN